MVLSPPLPEQTGYTSGVCRGGGVTIYVYIYKYIFIFSWPPPKGGGGPAPLKFHWGPPKILKILKVLEDLKGASPL